jgi:hypothetical protein
MMGGGERNREFEIRMAYCSACDHNVRVAFAPGAPDIESHPEVSELVCLEYGETCTGDMCPLFGVPSDQMRENLRRLLERTGPEAEG